jgi:Large polyvalent protein-associated domain 3
MDVAKIKSNFFGDYENQKDLLGKVKSWVKSNLTNKKIYVSSCDKTVELNWQGLKNDMGEYHPPYIEKLISFGVLDDIIANAVYSKQEQDKRNRLSVKAIHKFTSKVVIDDKIYDVVIICIESTANFIYDHILLE